MVGETVEIQVFKFTTYCHIASHLPFNGVSVVVFSAAILLLICPSRRVSQHDSIFLEFTLSQKQQFP